MTTIRLLKNGNEIFPAMLATIDKAESSIALEMYIFADDETGREFYMHLCQAAKRGVQVMVLVDAWGSWTLTTEFWKELRMYGGMVRWFHPLFRGLLPFRNHRKLLLVDDCVAFIGGINIANEYNNGSRGEPPWRDNALEISGREVARLRRSFLRMWVKADTPYRRLFHSRIGIHHEPIVLEGRLRFLESGPDNPLQPIRKAYHQLVSSATRNIDLAMSYFYPSGRMLRALRRAVRRGVRVRLIVPQKSDVIISGWATHGLYGRLLRAGIEVWEYEPAMMHAKIAIIDDSLVAGSANLDLRSGRINHELVVIVTDPAIVAKARGDFENDLRSSRQIIHEQWKKRPFPQKVKERLSYFFLVRADMFVAKMEMMRKMR